MPDKAHEWTDKEIDKLEEELQEIYEQASGDLQNKLQKALDSLGNEIPQLYEEYKALKANGEIEEANKKIIEYQNALKKAVHEKNFYNDQLKVISDDITHLNERAIAYVNNTLPDVAKYNYNYIGKETSKHIKGYSFHLADESTVKSMVKKLPLKKVKIAKDRAYNNKLINSQLLQGILQGEDIPTIAKRMQNVMGTEKADATRTARTLMTSAENQGRQESYERMQDDGIILKKVWIATPDSRTRETHLALDGTEINIDEAFETINGDKLMYPADPEAEGYEVYNCRCTLMTHVVGFKRADGSVKMIDYEPLESRHKRQIRKERQSREDKENG